MRKTSPMSIGSPRYCKAALCCSGLTVTAALCLVTVLIAGVGGATTSDLSTASSSEPTVACGPASLAIAFRILRVPIDDAELHLLADSTGQSTLGALNEYARSKGLYTAALALSPDELRSLHNVAILHVLSPTGVERGQRTGHFIVFAGPVQTGATGATAGAADEVYLFDAIGAHGLRGPFPLSELAEFYTGNALVLSRYPLDLSVTVEDGMAPVRWRMSWMAIPSAIVLAVAVLRQYRRRGCAARVRSRAIVTLAALLVCCPCAPASPATPATRPMISEFVVGTLDRDVGILAYGESRDAEFTLTNPRGAPMTVRLGDMTCGCASAQLAGSAEIPPGGTSRIRLIVRANARGRFTHGVFVHVSAQPAPLFLSISGTVTQVTFVEPRAIDFADVRNSDGAQQRPLSIIHYGPPDQPPSLGEITSSVPFLRVSTNSGFAAAGTRPEATEYRQSLVVELDPHAAPLGQFAELLTLNVTADGKSLQFKLICTGRLRPPIDARPSQIVAIAPKLPGEYQTEVVLQSPDGRAVRVGGVEAADVQLLRWSQEAAQDTGTVLRLVFQVAPGERRVVGVCRVTVEEPVKTVLELPARFIQTAQEAQR